MERLEIPVDGDSERWLDALDRGDEVVFVRDGKPVAELARPDRKGPIDPEALAKLHAIMAPIRGGSGAQLIRELRDASDH